MKLGPDMHNLSTFHLHRKEGRKELAGGRGSEKTIKKCHEISIISALRGPNNNLKNAMKVGVFLLSS